MPAEVADPGCITEGRGQGASLPSASRSAQQTGGAVEAPGSFPTALAEAPEVEAPRALAPGSLTLDSDQPLALAAPAVRRPSAEDHRALPEGLQADKGQAPGLLEAEMLALDPAARLLLDMFSIFASWNSKVPPSVVPPSQNQAQIRLHEGLSGPYAGIGVV